MQVITSLDFQLKNTAVCIGKFDGIHTGHRCLLSFAKDENLKMTMITFLFPKGQGIYSYREKLALAEQLGVEVFVGIPMTSEFMHMSKEQFVKEILVEKCNAKKVVVGADFCFGYQRSGNAQFLKKEGIRYGFETIICEKKKMDGEIISSTWIRTLLKEGNMQQVNKLLGTPYFMKGIVKKGNQIGRKMEVPTANIQPEEGKELPPYGVYTVRVKVQNTFYEGIGNLGVKPTIPGENPVGMEVWLFDFDGDLYDTAITVFLLAFQRKEKKFMSLDELKIQIEKDICMAKENLSHSKTSFASRSIPS